VEQAKNTNYEVLFGISIFLITSKKEIYSKIQKKKRGRKQERKI
jgi:hypothetical protein